MTSRELNLKLQSAIEKVSKIENTLSKHEAKADKLLKEIRSKGWDENNSWCMQGTEKHEDCYWLICDYESKLNDIKSNVRKLSEAKQVVENWEQKYMKQLKIENTITNELPEVFKQCQSELIEKWTQHDIERRELMLNRRKEMDHKEFRSLYNYSQESLINITDKQIERKATFEAEIFIIDLYNRVKNVIGQPTDYSNVRYNGNALNGFIVGEYGKCEVETITAGGYNIQRLHYRVLVKSL